ncbi:unnamed protein product [Prorocentrum cordatum]|uniref:Mei2-like C-terminal RNA recognition motif domain-containing protein n=1 Tax=Prorocentrum cordatum TaxID=2364126 RepID=A0ABN9SHC3_9DINO|nr:unnamed protein product [Polarella glacialis]
MAHVTEVRAIIKNTFLEFIGGEAPAVADSGRCRANSCPCIREREAPIDDGYSEGDSSACPKLSSLGSWADISETEEEDCFSCCASTDLKFWSPSGAEDKTPSKTGHALVQLPGSNRTPLSSKASAFVPTPLSSKASAFIPGAGAPKQANCSQGQASAPCAAQVPSVLQKDTTALMRNLPSDLSRGMLIKEMKKKGFAGLYDFVHFPLDVRSKKCLGYAYVNLTNMEHMRRFTSVFHGFKGWPVSSSKGCSIAFSQAIGYSTNAGQSGSKRATGEALRDISKEISAPNSTTESSKVWV